MTKVTVFTKETLIIGAALGAAKGYNRSLPNTQEALAEFNAYVEGLEADNYPVTFSMPREHIAGEKVAPHVRATLQMDTDGASYTLDVPMDFYNSLSTYDTETKEWNETDAKPLHHTIRQE